MGNERLSFLKVTVGFLFGYAASKWDAPEIVVIGGNSSAARMPGNNGVPIVNSVSRGFHPVYVYSKEPPNPYKSYSQVGQDAVIMKLIERHTKNGGESHRYFVDLAANDAIGLSNTLHLEQNGWRGLCIEGNPMYWYRLAAHRNCTVVGAFVGGTVDGEQVGVKLSSGTFGGVVGDKFHNKNGAEEKRNLVSISTVFYETSVPKVIDYMSLDVEGAEYVVMENFPFDTHKIRFMTVEQPRTDTQSLLLTHGYKRSAYDFVYWGETLWFHPDYINMTAEEVDEVANLKNSCRRREGCGVPAKMDW